MFDALAAEPAAVQLIVPLDIVALVQVFFTGIAAVGTVVAAIYAIWAKRQADAAAATAAVGVTKIEAVAVQIDGLLTERDKAKVKEGEHKQKLVGAEVAAALAQGQSEGRENERTSAKQDSKLQSGAGKEMPVPVVDDNIAAITKRVAEGIEKQAAASERLADEAEKPRPADAGEKKST